MKTNAKALIILSFFVAVLGLFAACSTRPIPGDLILTTYNSNMEATKQFAPLDTLYVKIAGMKPDSFYRISAIDASGNLISKIEARTNNEGVIDPTALWYDLGLKNNTNASLPPIIESFGNLTPVGFKVNVKSIYDDGKSTDFTQDLWIVYGKDPANTNPQPIVYACYMNPADSKLYPEHAFKEEGTLDINGNIDPKTKVYVKVDRIPSKIGNNIDVSKVDFYVMKFTGESLKNGDKLFDSDKYITRITGVSATDALAGVLLWNIDIINPGQDDMAYIIVMDVDRDGIYDQGIDTNNDGVSDYFIDGVCGNGVPGFIVQNTPANDLFVTIKNGTGATAKAVNTLKSDDTTSQLYINIDNVPVGKTQKIGVYLIDSTETGNTIFTVPDTYLGNPNTYRELRYGGKDANISLSTPGTNDIRYLPYLADHALLNMKTVKDSYSYYNNGTVISADKSFDLIIDVNNDGVFTPETDIIMPDAVTILYVPPAPSYSTCSDAAGTNMTQFFDETGTVGGTTTVYLKAQNPPALYDVYVMKDKTWTNGDYLINEVFNKRNLSGIGPSLIWDLNGDYKVINPDRTNNTYDLVIDNNQNGVYDYPGDTIVKVIILDTEANTYPRVSYVNIASGGSFGNIHNQHWTLYSQFCDYRDIFIASGADTNYYGGGYGIKAVFNPYFSWFSNPNPETPVAGLFYGKYVDVYIVNAKTFSLSKFGHSGELNDTVDVTGHHTTMPVQPSCYNGAWLVNIWPAPMKPGSYYVIVDVDRDGRITEGVDIIDAVNTNGKTIIDDPTIVGFTVQ